MPRATFALKSLHDSNAKTKQCTILDFLLGVLQSTMVCSVTQTSENIFPPVCFLSLRALPGLISRLYTADLILMRMRLLRQVHASAGWALSTDPLEKTTARSNGLHKCSC
jgi:hypothetical protein